jgi:glycosyltransferase involved in cell wall biosynthesis
MRAVPYSTLIRTFNSETTLPGTLASIESQTFRPSRYIIVDSGSTDRTLEIVSDNSVVHHYQTEKFNYSDSLNLGIGYADDDYLLIVSSHTSIENKFAIAFAIEILEENIDLAAAYFVQELSESMSFERIGGHNFSGFNGVWNTCAIYKTAYLRKRPFRPEVFSAEDQEWSSWLFSDVKLSVARISGAGMCYNNPAGVSLRKSLNERLSVAIFAKTEMQGFWFLMRTLYRAGRPISNLRERAINFLLFISLLRYRFSRRNDEACARLERTAPISKRSSSPT